MFKKRIKNIPEVIEIDQIINYLDALFEESTDKTRLKTIKDNFNYEISKLHKYIDLLSSREYQSKIPPEQDYLKKLSAKVCKEINIFTSEFYFPDSVFALTSFIENMTRTTEEIDNKFSTILNQLEEIVPNLVSRIKLKLSSLDNAIVLLNKFLEQIGIKTYDKINTLQKKYYETQELIDKFKSEKTDFVSQLTEINIMKDKTEARISALKCKRGAEKLKEIIDKKEKLNRMIEQDSTQVVLKLSYLIELLPDVNFSEFKIKIQNILLTHKKQFKSTITINIRRLLTTIRESLDGLYKFDSEVSTMNKDDLQQVIDSMIPFVNDIIESYEILKKSNIELHDNLLYLKYKEQEDAYMLWREKSDILKDEIAQIDIKLSDISLELIKQDLNKYVKEINKNLIIH